MRMSLVGKGVLAGILALGAAVPASAASKEDVDRILQYKPKQIGVAISTPTGAEAEKCSLDWVKNTNGGVAWILKDAKGSILRRVADSDGDKQFDTYAFYRDGMEVYREVAAKTGNRKTYQWLNGGGMKTGVDLDGDGSIDRWTSISLEEVSQEALKALANKDFNMLKPLLVTDDDLRGLGLPAKEIERISNVQKGTQAKFQQTLTKLAHLNPSTRWLHVEANAPSRILGETFGANRDVLMYYRSLTLCATGEKTDWIQLGETVQIGDAWKLIDAPVPGDAETGSAFATGGNKSTGPEPTPAMKALAELDAKAPPYAGGKDPAVVQFHLKRVEFLAAVEAEVAEAEKVNWQKQQADSLSTAVQAGDLGSLDRLAKLAMRFNQAGSREAAAYVTFRHITTEYAVSVMPNGGKPQDTLNAQNLFVDKLTKFVATYPTVEDAPDAMLQLGMINEFQGKEDLGKQWYQKLVSQAPKTPQAAKATGALRRLSLEGKAWDVGGPVASLSGGPFNPANLRGKTVIVYYYDSTVQTAAGDFVRLKNLMQNSNFNALRLDVVGINMDEKQADGETFVRRNSPPGYQLHSPGVDSPAATHYGLIILPHVFLINRDGNVINKALDFGSLEVELQKLVK